VEELNPGAAGAVPKEDSFGVVEAAPDPNRGFFGASVASEVANELVALLGWENKEGAMPSVLAAEVEPAPNLANWGADVVAATKGVAAVGVAAAVATETTAVVGAAATVGFTDAASLEGNGAILGNPVDFATSFAS